MTTPLTRAGRFLAEAASSDDERSDAMVLSLDSAQNFSGATDTQNSNSSSSAQSNKKSKPSQLFENIPATSQNSPPVTFAIIEQQMKELSETTLKSQLDDMRKIVQLENNILKIRNHVKHNTLPNDIKFKTVKHQYPKSVLDRDACILEEAACVAECQIKILEIRKNNYQRHFDNKQQAFVQKYSETNMKIEYNNMLAPYAANANIDQTALASRALNYLTDFVLNSNNLIKTFKKEQSEIKLKAQHKKDKSKSKNNSTDVSVNSDKTSKTATSTHSANSNKLLMKKLDNLCTLLGVNTADIDATAQPMNKNKNSIKSNLKQQQSVSKDTNNSSSSSSKSRKNDKTSVSHSTSNNNSHQNRSRNNSMTSVSSNNSGDRKVYHSTQSYQYNPYYNTPQLPYNYDNWHTQYNSYPHQVPHGTLFIPGQNAILPPRPPYLGPRGPGIGGGRGGRGQGPGRGRGRF